MAAMYWIGDMMGGDVWSNNQAWSLASGGAPAGAIPVTGDDVIFDNQSVRDCTMDMDAVVGTGNDIATMDCAGYTGTFNQNGRTIEITGLLFRLDAGMVGFTPGGGLLDFTGVAGVMLITSAGFTLSAIRIGNAGAGGTYQQQDNLTLELGFGGLDCVNGIWQTNNFNLTIPLDLRFRATMLANGFVAGTSTVTISGQLAWEPNVAVLDMGTSTFVFDSVGSILVAVGATVMNFYNLTISVAGAIFTYAGSLPGGRIVVNNIFLHGNGQTFFAGTGDGIVVQSTLVNGFQPDPAPSLNIPIILTPRTGAGTTVLIPPCTLGAGLILTRDGGTYGAVAFQLTGQVNVTGTLAAYGGGGAAFAPTLDLNGFNLICGGAINLGNGANGMGLVTIGAATMSCTGALTHLGNPLVDSRIFDIAGGTLGVGGNFTHTGAVATAGQRINMTLNSRVWVGGSWNTTAALVFNPVPVGDLSEVEFTAAGAFAIACNVSEVWPVVRITGGGTVALPNPFVCTDLVITAGTVTAGAVLRILRAFANGGTFTGGADMYVGTAFVNTGVLVMAGTNLHLTGPVCSISGFNPTTLTMESTLLRLQFLASCNITTALVIADRLVPGVIQFRAAGTFVFAVVNSQVVSIDGTVQLVSSVAGTRYNLTATVLTSKQNLWPRDCNYAGAAFVADLTNRDLGNNVGMTLNFPPAFVRVISEDVGQDLLAAGGIGPINYCWLVGTSLVNITALAAAFAAGGNNWHRKTNIPWVFLDNLVLGGNYWIALGLMDDRGVRVTPNIAGGDFVTATATSSESGGGGGHKIHVNVKVPSMS